ncbi:MAG: sugar transferase [Candidatus Gracilibacteria bacterium]|nr:sugar transferase [Candidatus Gracilibacteria bacterium]
MKRFEIFFGVIKAPVDFIMTVLAFLVAYKLRLITEPIKGIANPIDYNILPTINEYMNFSLIVAGALVLIFAFGKMYTFQSTTKFSKEISKAALLWAIWAMAMITYFFFTRTFPFSRLAIIYSWGLSFIFIFMGKALVGILESIFLRMNIGRRNLLFIGNNKLTHELSQNLEKEIGYKMIGILGENLKQSDKNNSLKIIGKIEEFEKIIKKYKIDEVIQTASLRSEKENADILEICDLNHIAFRFVPDAIEMRRTNIETSTIGTVPIISLNPTPLEGWGKISKRIMDIVGTSLAIIIFSPVMLITAIAIKVDSKGPILFTKLDNGSPVKRVGQFGGLIPFYKFRSMYPNTDTLRYTQLAKNNIRTDGPLVKIENDPRITKVGKFIRKFSIDELPQLFQVIKGDLSLVGPRPHLPEEVEKYQRKHKFSLTIKPGITGISQVSGRSNLTFDEEMKLDRYYIENWSIWLDLLIILKTFVVIFKGYKE